MSYQAENLDTLMNYSAEKRSQAFFEIVKAQNEIFILTDEHGAVMLVTEDEDCIPVWPSEEAALVWRNQEWEHCEAKAISLKEWFSKWTTGLLDDEVCVAVFPVPGEDGEVLMADEFEWLFQK
uniref:DUF2750 domain-containing protein n=1 Tax=Ningiella ruwaisensis TaxID=2364274 RepID=UPI001F4FD0DF|nr:DUF2750 domain-containing protein [Ningiella ruwaisensis]